MGSIQSALHFVPWQTRSFRSFRHQSYLGSILAMQQLCAKTNQSYNISITVYSQLIGRCLGPTHVYSWVNWGVMERTKMPKLLNGTIGNSVTRRKKCRVESSRKPKWWFTDVNKPKHMTSLYDSPPFILQTQRWNVPLFVIHTRFHAHSTVQWELHCYARGGFIL